jgi:hypothetical protein
VRHYFDLVSYTLPSSFLLYKMVFQDLIRREDMN